MSSSEDTSSVALSMVNGYGVGTLSLLDRSGTPYMWLLVLVYLLCTEAEILFPNPTPFLKILSMAFIGREVSGVEAGFAGTVGGESTLAVVPTVDLPFAKDSCLFDPACDLLSWLVELVVVGGAIEISGMTVPGTMYDCVSSRPDLALLEGLEIG